MFVSVLRKVPIMAVALGIGISVIQVNDAEAAVLDIYRGDNYGSVFAESSTIQSNKSAADFYNYSSFSGNPDDIKTTNYGASIWVQENTQTGAYSFGFIVGTDDSGIRNRVGIRLNIRNNKSTSSIGISDERHELRTNGKDSYVGNFKTYNNADGFIVEGITGTDWVIEFEILEDGNTKAFRSVGDDGRTSLWRSGVYTITLDGNAPTDPVNKIVSTEIMEEGSDDGDGGNNGANVIVTNLDNPNDQEENGPSQTDEVPEPAGLAIMGLGLLVLGAGLRRKHA